MLGTPVSSARNGWTNLEERQLMNPRNHGLEVCPLSKTNHRSLDFPINQFCPRFNICCFCNLTALFTVYYVTYTQVTA